MQYGFIYKINFSRTDRFTGDSGRSQADFTGGFKSDRAGAVVFDRPE